MDNDRLDRIEVGLGALQTNIAALTADVSQIVKVQGSQANQLQELQRADRDRRDTPWSTLISLALLILTIGAMALLPMREEIGEVKLEMKRHTDLAGHPDALIMHARHAERFDRVFGDIEKLSEQTEAANAAREEDLHQFDLTLQREMRLLDEVLQREMGLHVDRLDAELSELQRKLAGVEGTRFTVKDGDRLTQQIQELRAAGNRASPGQ